MELKNALNNTKKIYQSDASLNTLLDFERVLDEMDVFAFENWFAGELVEGPTVERYWLECKFMWPKSKMPDPRGAARLLPYNCRVSYEKTTIQIPIKIKSPDDFRPGTKQGKMTDVPVWIVTIRMPQELVSDIEAGSFEIASEEYDLEDIQQAYQQEVDQKSFMQNNNDDDFVNDTEETDDVA